MIHPNVERAIQEIDAAVHDGDTFDEPEARAELLAYAKGWVCALSCPPGAYDEVADPAEPEESAE